MLNGATAVEWILRIGAFMCFVGHGAFGVITKEGWVRYFAVAGIGRGMAYTLMPVVGALDITMGFLMLLIPMPVVGWWMVGWALWTASLRPLSGEPFAEAVERAGNYGVPAALLLFLASSADWKGLFRRGFKPLTPEVARWLRIALSIATALLLIGHGALGVMGKAGIVTNYASVMDAGTAKTITPWLGWFEIALGAAALLLPVVPLLIFIVIWKVATEALFVTAGAPVWEWVERGGSYTAPLALAVLLWSRPKLSSRAEMSSRA